MRAASFFIISVTVLLLIPPASQGATVPYGCPAVPVIDQVQNHGAADILDYACFLTTTPIRSDMQNYCDGGNVPYLAYCGVSTYQSRPNVDQLAAVTCTADNVDSSGETMYAYWISQDPPLSQGCPLGLSFVIPGQIVPPIPPTIACQTSDVTIDYGNVSPGEYNGSVRDKTGTITCTTDSAGITTTLVFSPETIELSNATQAHMTFQDTGNYTTDVHIDGAGHGSFTVRSTLSGSPAPGPFSGSTTIISSVK